MHKRNAVDQLRNGRVAPPHSRRFYSLPPEWWNAG